MIEHLSDILVVSDLDGTLLTVEEGIPRCNIEVIKLFCSLGGKFTVATGRSIEAVRPLLIQLPLSAPAILYNGALIYDFENEAEIYTRLLPIHAKDAFLKLSQKFPEIGSEIMADNFQIYITNSSEYTYKHAKDEGFNFIVKDIHQINNRWYKALFTSSELHQPDLIEYAKTIKQEGFYFVPTAPNYFEMVPNNVSKGEALSHLATQLNLSLENAIAIGDYYNDIDLLKTAGYSAVMQTAPHAVKSYANEIIPSASNGGVGQFLYQLIQKYAK